MNTFYHVVNRSFKIKKASLCQREASVLFLVETGGRVELPVRKSSLQSLCKLSRLFVNLLSTPSSSPNLGGEKEELGDTPILPRKDRQDPPKADCTSFEALLTPLSLGD